MTERPSAASSSATGRPASKNCASSIATTEARCGRHDGWVFTAVADGQRLVGDAGAGLDRYDRRCGCPWPARTRRTRRPATSARLMRRSISSVLPLNMQPVMRWIQPPAMSRSVALDAAHLEASRLRGRQPSRIAPPTVKSPLAISRSALAAGARPSIAARDRCSPTVDDGIETAGQRACNGQLPRPPYAWTGQLTARQAPSAAGTIRCAARSVSTSCAGQSQR